MLDRQTEIPTDTRASAPALDFDDVPVQARRRPQRWRTAIVIGVLLAGAALAAWMWKGEAPAAAMITAPVTKGEVVDTVSALGNLQPRDYVDLGAQVSGQLKKIHVAVGDEVKTGALMAEIDPVVLNTKVEGGRASLAGLRAELLDKEAQRDLANQSLERQKRLLATKAASQQTYDTAEATARSASAQVDMLKAQIQQTDSTLRGDEATLGYTKITTPMDGTVVSLSAREGQTINANQQAPILLRVADLSTMTVWTQVSEADISRLKLGMKAQFTTLGAEGRRWEGTLRQILPTPEVLNNVVLYTALFDVANPKGELMTQMSAQVFFVVSEAHDVLTVPATALQEVGNPGSGKYTVEVQRAFGTETVPVEVGVKTRVLAEIRSGLSEGDVVVLGSGTAGATAGQAPRRQGRPGGLRLP